MLLARCLGRWGKCAVQVSNVENQPTAKFCVAWQTNAAPEAKFWSGPGADWVTARPTGAAANWPLASDPDFEAKAADFIGLYLDPPQHAAVFCMNK
jgi:hypothetical protein